jgi:hypothetical protein
VTVHFPDAREHVEVLKLPPAPPSLHVTVPVGVDGDPALVSLTAEVNVIGLPAVTADGFGVTTTLTDRAPTVNDEVPELAA